MPTNLLANSTINVTQILSRFVVDTTYQQLSAHAINNAKRCLLDALGVSIAATSLGQDCDRFAEVVSHSLVAESTLLGIGKKASCIEAAWVNGALAHALDYEDAHDASLTHPNAASIPAALAISEALGSVSGEELITAIVVGCEVTCRLAMAVDKPLDDFGWYPPPIFGAFGATAAVAKLLKLDAQQMANAFSLTLCNTSCSAEIKYNPQSSIRGIRDAFSAQTGVQSAMLAVRGVSGFEQPFEGKAGLFNNFARGHVTLNRITADLGLRFAIAEIGFKLWPSCRGTHAFIESALSLMDQHQINPDHIVRIVAKGSRINRMLAEPLATKQQPLTAIDAKFSIPFTVALALRFGEVSLPHFSQDGLKDELVLKLAKLVSYEIDESLDDQPASMTHGTLEIVTRSVDTGENRYQKIITKPVGGSERPLSDQQLIEKFKDCCQFSAVSMPDLQINSLINTIKSLELQTNLHDTLFPQLLNS